MATDMSPPDSNTLWDWVGAAMLAAGSGVVGSWIHNKVKSAVLDAEFKRFLMQYQLDRSLDREINNRRHEDNKDETKKNRDEIGKVADTVGELNRYLRNGWREKGH